VLYEPEKLSSVAKDLLTDKNNQVYVSLSSLWELGSKAAVNRLPLAGSSVDLIATKIEEFGVKWLSLTKQDIVKATSLPPHHLDPFDRILIALAQTHSLPVVTKDPKFTLYDVVTLW
jgi:PIN domain nuclease of toxin-antitoxin system